MRKVIYTCIILSMSLLLYGCRETHTYEYLYDQEKISKIEIIYVELFQDELNILVIKDIEDTELLMNRLNDIEFGKYLYVDQPTIYDKYAILITYDTDDFEVITYDAQEVFFSVDNTSRQSRFYCDIETFQALLNLYDEDIKFD